MVNDLGRASAKIDSLLQEHFYFCLQNESKANIQGKDSPPIHNYTIKHKHNKKHWSTQPNFSVPKGSFNQCKQDLTILWIFPLYSSWAATQTVETRMCEREQCGSVYYYMWTLWTMWRQILQYVNNVNNVETYITICEQCEQCIGGPEFPDAGDLERHDDSRPASLPPPSLALLLRHHRHYDRHRRHRHHRHHHHSNQPGDLFCLQYVSHSVDCFGQNLQFSDRVCKQKNWLLKMCAAWLYLWLKLVHNEWSATRKKLSPLTIMGNSLKYFCK